MTLFSAINIWPRIYRKQNLKKGGEKMAAEVKKVDANDLTKLSIDLAVGQGP